MKINLFLFTSLRPYVT